MKVKDTYLQEKIRLQNAGVETATLDARLLLCHALQINHEDFVLRSDRDLSTIEIQTANTLIAQRLAGRPVAKIIGRKEFYGRDFLTTDDTLDPRPDSETLVEAALSFEGEKIKILDLGTGTGCLLLTLLAELPQATGIGVDQSPAALAVAAENARRLHLTERVQFLRSDWFKAVTGEFDIIISNPPYIPDSDIATLAREVRAYDPHAALAGGADGLDPYRVIVPQLARFLKPGGLAAFELGQGQAPAVAALLAKQGFTAIKAHNDLAGIARVVSGIRPE